MLDEGTLVVMVCGGEVGDMVVCEWKFAWECWCVDRW